MSLDSIPTLPRALNVSGDDLIGIIDMADRRSPKSVTLTDAVAAVGITESSLSLTGGADKVPQFDSDGNLTTGPFANGGTGFGHSGNIFIPDQQGIRWLKQDGTLSNARIRMWEDHDADGGELIIDSPNRIALIPYGGLQIGPNDTGSYLRYAQFVAGSASASMTNMPSGSILLQTETWNGSTSVESHVGLQAHALDDSGANNVLKIYDDAWPTGGGTILTPGRNDLTGTLMAEIEQRGIWSNGTAPEFNESGDGSLTDNGTTITHTLSKYKTVQAAKVTLGGNRTLAFSGLLAGMRGVILVTQDGSGNRTLTPSGGSALGLSTTGGYTDRVTWDFDGLYVNFAVQQNVSRLVVVSDTDAQNFISQASISDNTQKAAISTLVEALKASNVDGTGTLWSKSYALYPFVGGTETAHSQDLKGSYDGTYGGTVTHDANGITGNGTNGYFQTPFNPNDEDTLNSLGIYAYCRTQTPTDGGRFVGCYDASTERCELYRNAAFLNGGGLNRNDVTPLISTGTDFRKHLALMRTGASAQLIYQGSAGSAQNTTATGKVDRTVCFLARQWAANTRDNFSNANLAFGAITQGLTSTEYAAFRTIVDAFQTTLGRAN